MENILYNSSLGDGYNQTRMADPFIAGRIYDSIFLAGDKLYLDIGCGTGNYAIALYKKGLSMYGADPSEKMLTTAMGRENNIKWLKGSAEAIPARDDFFAGLYGTLTLHHWTDISKAFKELYRVLEPGGKMAFFTSTPMQMEGYWLKYYFPEMMEKAALQMPDLEILESSALNAGFKLLPAEKYFVKDDLQDNFLYVGKNRPDVYFDEVIRHGISAFAALSDAEEVEQGLQRLKADMQTGKFQSINESFENKEGDYLIFKAMKPL